MYILPRIHFQRFAHNLVQIKYTELLNTCRQWTISRFQTLLHCLQSNRVFKSQQCRLTCILEDVGSGGIEKSHSCKWAKWIQWHALPHIQQSTQQRNKGYYPNLRGWDFSIPPSPRWEVRDVPTRTYNDRKITLTSMPTYHRKDCLRMIFVWSWKLYFKKLDSKSFMCIYIRVLFL